VQADAEDHPAELLGSKPGDGHPDRPMPPGARVHPAGPTLEVATARDGTAVRLRPLRRDEQELVAGRPDRSARRSGGHRLPVALQDGGRGAAGATTGPSRAAPQGAARLVTCTTTARFRRVEGGTQLRLGMHDRVAGGPVGGLFGSRVGDEMVTTVRGDLGRLKALAEEQAGTAEADAQP